MRAPCLALFAAACLAAPTASAHDLDEDRPDVGVALRTVHRIVSLDSFAPSNVHGLSVSEHARFGRWVGAQVTFAVTSGIDAHGYGRTDLEFAMPAILVFFPTLDHVRPYFATGPVMTATFFHGPATPGTGGFMYAGNQTALGFELKRTKKMSFLFEIATTLRGRFAVDQKDRPALEGAPVFERDTRVVHEGSLSLGVVLY